MNRGWDGEDCCLPLSQVSEGFVSTTLLTSVTETPVYAKVRPVRGVRCRYCNRLALNGDEVCQGCGAPR